MSTDSLGVEHWWNNLHRWPLPSLSQASNIESGKSLPFSHWLCATSWTSRRGTAWTFWPQQSFPSSRWFLGIQAALKKLLRADLELPVFVQNCWVLVPLPLAELFGTQSKELFVPWVRVQLKGFVWAFCSRVHVVPRAHAQMWGACCPDVSLDIFKSSVGMGWLSQNLHLTRTFVQSCHLLQRAKGSLKSML